MDLKSTEWFNTLPWGENTNYAVPCVRSLAQGRRYRLPGWNTKRLGRFFDCIAIDTFGRGRIMGCSHLLCCQHQVPIAFSRRTPRIKARGRAKRTSVPALFLASLDPCITCFHWCRLLSCLLCLAWLEVAYTGHKEGWIHSSSYVCLLIGVGVLYHLLLMLMLPLCSGFGIFRCEHM